MSPEPEEQTESAITGEVSESDRDDDGDDQIRPGATTESGYDTDPVERFFIISKWQRQLRKIQGGLRNGSSEMLNRRKDEVGPLRNLRERRRQVVSKVIEQRDQMVGRVKDKSEKVVDTVKKQREQMVGNIRERQQKLKQNVEMFKKRTEKVLSRMRVAKIRQFRHMICFSGTLTNVVILAFWLGRFPHTFHWWYTVAIVWLIGCRAVWYRWHLWHYYLLDLCYWANAGVLTYLWILPRNEWFFCGLYGLNGTLLISIIVFRNSLVPHSLDYVTNLSIHILPVLQLWILRWEGPTWSNSRFRIPKEMSVVPGFTMYLTWALIYYMYIFVLAQKTIDRRGYETLYKHMAVNMGLKKKLPRRLQEYSKVVFITGHFILFLMGIPFVHFPYWLHTAALIISSVWSIRNGATFYMTYFWKVYETQIHEFERQMAQAQQESEAQEQPQSPTAVSPSSSAELLAQQCNGQHNDDEGEDGAMDQQDNCADDEEGLECLSPH